MLQIQTNLKTLCAAIVVTALMSAVSVANAQEKGVMMVADNKKVTAGREQLGSIAPKFAELNDDVLFGQVWSREQELSARDRSLVTIVSLIAGGNFPQLKFHLQKGKDNGLSKQEIVEIITHQAFYSGWPKAWSAFGIVKEVYGESDAANTNLSNSTIFPLGDRGSSEWFSGVVWVQPLVNPNEMENLYAVGSVTFEAGGRTHWHTHPIGQVLLVTEGEGWYQERGQKARALAKGDVVVIPKDTEHWHGAAYSSRFVHIAITNVKEGKNVTWLNNVTDKEYKEATK